MIQENYEIRQGGLIRQALRDGLAQKRELANETIEAALDYFGRINDTQAVRDAMKARFATGIVRVGDSDGSSGYETYKHGVLGEQIDLGMIEALSVGVGVKISSALATLFTAKDQRWGIDEQWEDVVSEHREAGGFSRAIVEADKIACSVNSGWVYVDWRSGHLRYRPVSPASIYAIYHETITDDGVERGTDSGEIEDATVVVVRLSGQLDADPTKQQFLAIFGRSEVYPQGRHVVYRARRWDDIPEVDRGGVEYRGPDGEVANPLSLVANEAESAGLNVQIPEYPLVQFHGGLCRTTGDLVVTTTSMVDACVELDIAYSRLLKDTLSSVRGSKAITNELNLPLPRTLEGDVVLLSGQGVTPLEGDASNGVSGLEVVNGVAAMVGSSYSVPDYQVLSSGSSVEQASGISLAIRTKPLLQFRDRRIELNRSEVDRLYSVEVALLYAYVWGLGSDTAVLESEQDWHPGGLDIPQARKDEIDGIVAELGAKLIDRVEAVRRAWGLGTVDEAIDVLTAMAAPERAAFSADARRPVAAPVATKITPGTV